MYAYFMNVYKNVLAQRWYKATAEHIMYGVTSAIMSFVIHFSKDLKVEVYTSNLLFFDVASNYNSCE